MNPEAIPQVRRAPTPERAWWLRLLVGRNVKWTLLRATLTAAGLFALLQFVLMPVRIEGISMEPTYHDGGLNLVNQLAYHWSAPARGDVVAIRIGQWRLLSALKDLLAGHRNSRAAYLKRIIALPGETVSIENGVVMVNGRALDEPYVIARELWSVARIQLGDHEYFVVGDNRGMNQEAHVFGRTDREKIMGKTLW